MDTTSTITTTITTNTDKTSSVAILIAQLEKLLSINHEFVKSIQRPNVLISALKQLNDMIEMELFKLSIVETIQSSMINVYSQKNKTCKNKFDNQMLHFCNYGDPGTGKTRASKLLAKIFYGMGIDYDNQIYNVTQSKDEKNNVYTDKLQEITASLIEIKQQAVLSLNEYKTLKENYAKKQIVNSNVRNDSIGKKEGTNLVNKINENPQQEKLNSSWKDLNASLMSINESVNSVIENVSIIGESVQENNEKINVNIDDDPNVEESVYCVVCGRNELVAKFAGQTAGQAYDFLMTNRFKTIIIEEAYDLINGDRSGYGDEALVQINRFMDEHPTWAIIGFNGYQEKLEETIFTAQPGLLSRISRFYHMTHYTSKGLGQIFKLQLESLDLKLDDSIDINKFFSDNITLFSAFGRDTFHFAHSIKTVYFSHLFTGIFESVLKGENSDIKFVINKEIFDMVVGRFKDLRFKSTEN